MQPGPNNALPPHLEAILVGMLMSSMTLTGDKRSTDNQPYWQYLGDLSDATIAQAFFTETMRDLVEIYGNVEEARAAILPSTICNVRMRYRLIMKAATPASIETKQKNRERIDALEAAHAVLTKDVHDIMSYLTRTDPSWRRDNNDIAHAQ